MASATAKRHHLPPEDEGDGTERDVKKGKYEAEDGGPTADLHLGPSIRRVLLNPADCNLDFNIEGDGLCGSALHEKGFAYCWSGARANVGIRGGKYCFGCKIIGPQPVDMDDTLPDQKNLCRVGISRGDAGIESLGETPHSFGFGGTGKFSSAGKFLDYGEKFDVGDTIICCVDLESKPMASISFSKNGKWLGVAMQFDAGSGGLGVVDCPIKRLEWQSALFPHVLLKNVVVQLQFSTEDGLLPQEGYKPWALAVEDRKVILGPTFQNVSDCELIMMVGLPASGKSTWAENWVKAHPEKRYVLLGTNLILDQMKVPGLHRRHNYGERFDRLMERATEIFNILLTRASKLPRNFIIDQTNVYKNARKRKLKPFASYQKIAVVVFPKLEDLKNRAEKRFREMGKEIPAEAVNEMLANYTLPMSKDMRSTDEFFDEVYFPELSREESQICLDQMKLDLKNRVTSPPSGKGVVQSYASRMTSLQSGKGSFQSDDSHLHETSIPPFGARLQNQGSLHQKSILPLGAPLQNQGSFHEKSVPPVEAPQQNQGSLPDGMSFARPWPNSYLPHPPLGAPLQNQGSFHEKSVPPVEAPMQNQGSFPDGMSFASPWSNSYLPHPPLGAPVQSQGSFQEKSIPVLEAPLQNHGSLLGGMNFARPRSNSYLPHPPVEAAPRGYSPLSAINNLGSYGSRGSPYGTPIPRPMYGDFPSGSPYETPDSRPPYGDFQPGTGHPRGYGPPRLWYY